MRGEVKRRVSKLGLVRKQLEEAEGLRKGKRSVGEGEVERLQEPEKGLEMVERLGTLPFSLLKHWYCCAIQGE